jgi:hypothetical protein
MTSKNMVEIEDPHSSLSPSAASKISNLKLPSTCDPPGEQNPPKQAVWIVWSLPFASIQKLEADVGARYSVPRAI